MASAHHAKTTTPKAPQDLTLRNLRAVRKDLTLLSVRVRILEIALATRERREKPGFASGEGGDALGED